MHVVVLYAYYSEDFELSSTKKWLIVRQEVAVVEIEVVVLAVGEGEVEAEDGEAGVVGIGEAGVVEIGKAEAVVVIGVEAGKKRITIRVQKTITVKLLVNLVDPPLTGIIAIIAMVVAGLIIDCSIPIIFLKI